MKKIILSLILCAGVLQAFACTNFIVGKKASADGSVICSYNADDYGMFINLCHFPAGKHAKGEMADLRLGHERVSRRDSGGCRDV